MNVETRPSLIHGTGVFALRSFPRGAVILVIDDSRVVNAQNPVNTDQGEDPDHCDYLPDGTTVLMPVPERFINHSCQPNAYAYSVNRRRFLLAMHDIPDGDEILWDYAINASNGDTWTCQCGAPNCRGRHKCDFFSLPNDRQLEYLPYLDLWFVAAHQTEIKRLLESQPA